MVAAYGIKPGMRILDVRSGKGFILHDFRESVPVVEVAGIDISSYGVEHTMEDVKPFCEVGTGFRLPRDRAGGTRREIYLCRELPQRGKKST